MDKESFLKHIETLKTYVKTLKSLQKDTTLARLQKDFERQGAVKHYLQLAIQSVIDLGAAIIGKYNFSTPSAFSEIFKILAQNNVLPAKLAANLAEMAKVRNILVHEYLDVDLGLIYKFLDKNLEDFEKFLEHIVKYTDENP